MEVLLKIVNFVAQNYQAILSGIDGILLGVIAICVLLPGPQPEKALQGIVDFIAKFSKK